MKSWKTTLGGSLENLGSSLRDMVMLGSFVQLGSGDQVHSLNFILMVTGTIINALGKFVSNLCAADNSAVSSALEQHTQEISELKRDTATITKPDETLTSPAPKI